MRAIDAVDLSPGALEVAARNLDEHGLGDRIALQQGDLVRAASRGKRYDLILTNPPYVDAAAIAAFRLNLRPSPGSRMPGARMGSTSCAASCARRLIILTTDGTLVCEVGGAGPLLELEFPHLPFVWLDTADTSGEVFLLRAADLGAAKPRAKGRR